MNSYNEWNKARKERAEAENWFSLLGKPSVQATAKHVGEITSASGSFSIHYQPYDGATNYHDAPKPLAAALSKVMKDEALSLISKSLEVMRELEKQTLIKCDSDIEAMAKLIREAKQP